MNKQYQKSGYLYDKLDLKYNTTSGVLEINPKDPVKYLQMNREQQEQTVAQEIFTKAVQPLADKLGTKFQVITQAEAYDITKDSKIPYNGESAFNLNGTAYVLDSALTLTNGIHEIIHPFVDGVLASNPVLFTKLYSDFIRTNTGAKIAQDVSQQYQDVSTEEQQKETLVRGITALAKNNLEFGEKPVVDGIFNKFWYTLKQIFRKLFGSAIRVADLNENTTLRELADMLTGDNFKIDSSVVPNDDIIRFNKDNINLIRDMTDDITKLGDKKITKVVDDYFTVIDDHVKRVLYNKEEN